MQIHADALAAKGDAFALQPHLLFEARFTGQADLPSSAEYAMPRKTAR